MLLGHVKNWATRRALKTAFPDSDAGRPFLDAYFPQRLRATLREQFAEASAAPRDHRDGGGELRDQQGGHPFLLPLTAATGKDIGAVMQAYLEVDRESGAGELRDRVLAAGLHAREGARGAAADRGRARAGARAPRSMARPPT